MLICSRFSKAATIFGDTNNRYFLHSTPFYHEFSWCTAPFKKKEKGKKEVKGNQPRQEGGLRSQSAAAQREGTVWEHQNTNVGVGEKGPFGANSSAWRRAKTSEPRGKVIDFHWYSFSIPQVEFFFPFHSFFLKLLPRLLTIKTDGRLICVSRVNIQLISHGGSCDPLKQKSKQNKNRLSFTLLAKFSKQQSSLLQRYLLSWI